ncbi:hypothetical protein RM717_00365 [Streptomyces griseus]|uniref:Uncharacterized protein n=1 Tax=Streptomyces stephensoniae TaxID=3375367 RepID=A0ABU2VTM9_9ACTN|nr:hypothetical protein [Streptomyces griseus]MDT0488955.1 hypothetical protein [Streptomyces griseus]
MTALAASGATALVGLMATEAWNQVRGRVARFLARNDEESAAVDAELEESRAELIGLRAGADEDSAADTEEEWRLRLRRALRTNPEAAELKGAPRPASVPTGTRRGRLVCMATPKGYGYTVRSRLLSAHRISSGAATISGSGGKSGDRMVRPSPPTGPQRG